MEAEAGNAAKMLLNVEQSVLIVVDVQERLAPMMDQLPHFLRNTELLMRAAARLDVPMIVTEQYPGGIGRTIEAIARLAPPEAVVEKISFSAAGSEEFNRRFAELGRREPIICGIEAHVCVLQTALELQAQGFATRLVRDATTSRKRESAKAAHERAARNGIELVTAEMVVFEWMRRAGTPVFREMLALIK